LASFKETKKKEKIKNKTKTKTNATYQCGHMQYIIFSTHCNSSVVFVPSVHESCNAEKNKQTNIKKNKNKKE